MMLADTSDRFDPRHWRPGDRIKSAETGYGKRMRTLKERKHDGTGWWLTDGTGLSDKAASLGWTIARDEPAMGSTEGAAEVIGRELARLSGNITGSSINVGLTVARKLAAAGLLVTPAERTVIDTLDALLNRLGDEMLHRSATWFPHAHRDPEALMVHLGMGCGGEGGEVCDEVKKLHRDGDYSDTSKVAMELCDSLTYTVMLGRTIGIDWSAALAAMVAKCEARWGAVDALNAAPPTPGPDWQQIATDLYEGVGALEDATPGGFRRIPAPLQAGIDAWEAATS